MAKTQGAGLGKSRQGGVVLAFILAIVVISSNARAGQFRASVVKVDITPDKTAWLKGYDARQSTGVHDHIFHRIVAMDDGKTQFFLISTELVSFSPSIYDEVTKKLEEETGIKPVQVWWTVTHTHSAPEVGPPGLSGVFMANRFKHAPDTEYTAHLERQLIDGIKEARQKLEARAAGGRPGIRARQH